MDIQTAIKALESEWEMEVGFLGLLREGILDKEGFCRFESTLNSIDLGAEPYIDRRIVSLIWMIPLFMSWQWDRVAERGNDMEELQNYTARVEGIVERLLGLP